MSDEDISAIRTALSSHGAFEKRDGVFACTTTPFDATVGARPADGQRAGGFEVTVKLPTLDAAVDGEQVADAVEDGWYDTLSLRLEDTFDVAQASSNEHVTVERENGTVRVELEFTAANAGQGVDDAKALIEFVEGTYLQGIVPGYDYGDPVAQLLSAARRRGDQATEGDDGSERGGTPL
ncbi:DUF5813 family protein [Halostella sp. PRR32]|uniref:DUF5813 family protein n=1 Tax=Halostella sp. PRR32 TaxID=3098147 RepID=UPI002B1D57F6|nr:DUF5813 family protein [Halostella sp. PRR32]